MHDWDINTTMTIDGIYRMIKLFMADCKIEVIQIQAQVNIKKLLISEV